MTRKRCYIDDYHCIDISKRNRLHDTKAPNVSAGIHKANWIISHAGKRYLIDSCYQMANYGGVREYLLCPICNTKRKQLYFKDDEYACRQCHGLSYRCESLAKDRKNYLQLDKLIQKVCPSAPNDKRWGTFTKVRWQHWQTYYKIANKIDKRRRTALGLADISIKALVARIESKKHKQPDCKPHHHCH